MDDELWTKQENSVRVNHFEGGYEATRYLLKNGRKKIAFVSEPLVMEAIKDRLAGYEKAHEDAGVLMDKSRVITAGSVYDKFIMGYELGRNIAKNDLDGIFAASDVIAFGVMRALAEAGKKVPGGYRHHWI